MSASTLTHPIDLVKVRMLLHGEGQRGQVLRLSVFRDIYRADGVRGFYNGLSAALLRQALFSTTRFGFYDIMKRALGETKQRRLPYTRKVVATVVCGATAAAVGCPADMVLVRMQADGRLPAAQRRNYRNVLDAMYRVLREEGPTQLYRGLSPLLVRGVAVTTAQFATYDTVKEWLMHAARRGDTLATHFAASAVAGLTAAIVSTPLDVVKSRMMNATSVGQHGNSAVRYANAWQCVRLTARGEGARGFFKGFVPCYARMGPQVVLMWLFVEEYRKLWDRFIEKRE